MINVIASRDSGLPQEVVQAFGMVAECFAVHLKVSAGNVEKIEIVRPNAVSARVNAIIQESGISGAYLNNNAIAVAIPLERVDQCGSVFVLGADIVVDALTQAQSESTAFLIEELLHARLFGMIWDRGERVSLDDRLTPCEQQLSALASSQYMEYVVNRWKFKVMSPAKPELMNIHNTVRAAVSSIEDIIQMFRQRAVDVKEAWRAVLAQTHREVFDPLVRNAALRDELIPSEPSVWGGNQEVDTVVPHWEAIYPILRDDFESGRFDYSSSVRALIEHEERFLNDMGIALTNLADGGCWVEFGRS